MIIASVFQNICNLNVYDENKLDSLITAKVKKADGTILEYDSNILDQKATSGDVIDFYIPLPDKKPYPDTSFCTVIYNCPTEIICNGETISEFGKDIMENGGIIGNCLINTRLHDNVFGNKIILRCIVPEGNTISKIVNLRLMPTEYSLRHVLINHEMDFVFCMSMIAVSILALLILLLMGKFKNELYRQGIYLFIFFVLTGIWILGSNDILYFMMNNYSLCSTLEYFAMFLIPIPYCSFLALEFNGIFRNIFKIMALIFFVDAAVVITLNFVSDLHFYRFTHYQRILIVLGLIITVAIMILNRKKQTINEKIIKIGTIISILVMALEVIRYELADTTYLFRTLFSTSLTVFGIMIYVFSLLFGYYSKLSEEIIRNRNLRVVAYTDGMTGIPNRTAVIDQLNSLRSDEDYGIAFFDVNDLKKANDIYGHETGDLLITSVAGVLNKAFIERDGFVGRYGGDEFVACFTNNSKKMIEQAINDFTEGIKNLNEKKILPFDINVAFGTFVNDPDSPVEHDDGIKQADSNMYEAKKKMKSKAYTD